MKEKSKILLISRNLPPLVGGMERLNWHIIKELSLSNRLHTIGPSSAKQQVPENSEFYGVPLSPLWQFLLLSVVRGIFLARKLRPNVVMAGSGLTAPATWMSARLAKATSAVYLHGLDIAFKHPVYRCLWLPFIRRMDRVIANSHATRDLAIAAGVEPAKIGIVHPGVELPGEETINSNNAFRERYGLTASPILLSVGRLTERKGMREFVTSALPRIAQHYPDVQLVIVGGEANNALAARSQSRGSIMASAKSAGVGENVKFVGTITDYKLLGDAFRASSVHVFPVRELPCDPEGFGMVAVEAAAHGLATVAFATGGTVDAVSHGTTGWLVKAGDYPGFADKVVKCIQREASPAWRDGCLEFARQKAWPAFRTNMENELAIQTARK